MFSAPAPPSPTRRNLDYAFPPFAYGLPSVYERAGFDVNPSLSRSRSGSRSSSVRKGSFSGSASGSASSLRSQGSFGGPLGSQREDSLASTPGSQYSQSEPNLGKPMPPVTEIRRPSSPLVNGSSLPKKPDFNPYQTASSGPPSAAPPSRAPPGENPDITYNPYKPNQASSPEPPVPPVHTRMPDVVVVDEDQNANPYNKSESSSPDQQTHSQSASNTSTATSDFEFLDTKPMHTMPLNVKPAWAQAQDRSYIQEKMPSGEPQSSGSIGQQRYPAPPVQIPANAPQAAGPTGNQNYPAPPPMQTHAYGGPQAPGFAGQPGYPVPPHMKIPVSKPAPNQFAAKPTLNIPHPGQQAMQGHQNVTAPRQPGGFLGVPQQPDLNRMSTTSSVYSNRASVMPPPVPEHAPEPRDLEPLRDSAIQHNEESESSMSFDFADTSRPPSTPLADMSMVSQASQGSGNSHTSSGKKKKFCRGCMNPIVGKSVRSRDGTLTGRWHRECFLCTRCETPLTGTSSDIHVHEDQPFCPGCYHVVAHTTCRMCGKGIEGSCLEATAEAGSPAATPLLYHVNCLRCAECQIHLQQSYFEVDGATYCAEHAFTSLPHNTEVHKRFTQFMMI